MNIDENADHPTPDAPNTVAFQVEMLPAGEGDCLLVTVPGDERDFRILVDTGNGRTALKAIKERLAHLPVNDGDGLRHVNLFIITHIDDDHLEHAAALLTDQDLKLSFDDIWFNGYYELQSEPPRAVDLGLLSENQANILTNVLHDLNLSHNKAFDHGPVQVPGVPGEPPTLLKTSGPTRSSGSFRRVDLGPGAPQITLLSPLPQDLRELG